MPKSKISANLEHDDSIEDNNLTSSQGEMAAKNLTLVV
jgi:hypothetical protein